MSWDLLAQLVGPVTFVVVLLQSLRSRKAHQSTQELVQQAHDRAAEAEAAASSLIRVVQPAVADLAIAVQRLPKTRQRLGKPGMPPNGSEPPAPPAGEEPVQ